MTINAGTPKVNKRFNDLFSETHIQISQVLTSKTTVYNNTKESVIFLCNKRNIHDTWECFRNSRFEL